MSDRGASEGTERDATAPNDPQTGNGAVWGAEFVDTGGGDDPVENEPGSQAPPATDDPSPA